MRHTPSASPESAHSRRIAASSSASVRSVSPGWWVWPARQSENAL
jgi:hypothetical protein